MISIKILAMLLLVFRIASDVFIFSVLRKQWALLKVKIDPELRNFRRVLFYLSLAVFLGNIIPIIIDGLTVVYGNMNRPQHVAPISILYALSNASTALISAFLIWLLYRLASNTHDITEYTEQHLRDELSTLRKPDK